MCILCDGNDISDWTYIKIECPNIQVLPELPEGLIELYCKNCPKLLGLTFLRPQSSLPSTLKNLKCIDCPNLVYLGKNLPDLVKITLKNTDIILSTLPNSLLTLTYEGDFSNIPELPSSLALLEIRSNFIFELPTTLPDSLKYFRIMCPNLTSLPTLPAYLEDLICSYCSELEYLPELPNTLETLDCNFCVRLSSLPILSASLKELICSYCTNLTTIGILPNTLESLDCSKCSLISSLPPIPDSLTKLEVSIEYLNEESRIRYNNFIEEDREEKEDETEINEIIERETGYSSLDNCLVLNFPEPSEFIIFNSYMAEEVNMKEYLEEDINNICFITILDNGSFKGYGCSLDQIKSRNLIVQCKNKYNGTILKPHVLWDKWYNRIGFDTTNSGIIMSKLATLESRLKVSFINPKHKIYFLSNSKILPYVATVKNVGISTVYDQRMGGSVYVDIFGRKLDYTSGNHCTLKGLLTYEGPGTICKK